MAKEKMMNEARFSKMVGEFDSLGELIKTRQDEKQSVMDEFDKERKRFGSGKISEKTVASSAKKTNSEMAKLNSEVRTIISKANKMANEIKELVSNQSPKVFNASVSGITLKGAKKKAKRSVKKRVKKGVKKKAERVVKKKTIKRKTIKRKPARKKARSPAKRRKKK